MCIITAHTPSAGSCKHQAVLPVMASPGSSSDCRDLAAEGSATTCQSAEGGEFSIFPEQPPQTQPLPPSPPSLILPGTASALCPHRHRNQGVPGYIAPPGWLGQRVTASMPGWRLFSPWGRHRRRTNWVPKRGQLAAGERVRLFTSPGGRRGAVWVEAPLEGEALPS